MFKWKSNRKVTVKSEKEVPDPIPDEPVVAPSADPIKEDVEIADEEKEIDAPEPNDTESATEEEVIGETDPIPEDPVVAPSTDPSEEDIVGEDEDDSIAPEKEDDDCCFGFGNFLVGVLKMK